MSTRPGFWARQFDSSPTVVQTVTDVILGIVGPIACVVWDPIVFREGMGLSPGFAPIAPFAYAFIATQIAILGAWILLRSRLASSAAYFAGPLVAGGIFSMLLGFALLPVSIFGLLMLIGIFGFTPFLTAIIYFRNALRALRRSGNAWVGGLLLGAGLLCAPLPAFLVQREAERAIADVIADPEDRDAVRRASWLSAPLAEDLAHAYLKEPSKSRRDGLANAYRKITGRILEDSLVFTD